MFTGGPRVAVLVWRWVIAIAIRSPNDGACAQSVTRSGTLTDPSA